MKNTFFLFLTIVLFAGCGGDRQRRIDAIAENERLLFADSTHGLNHEKAVAQLKSYREFAEKYPADSLSPEYLFKGADLANGLGQATEGIAMLKTLRATYPDHPRAGTALFMIAFFCETTLHDNARAQEGYAEFLKQYPDHQLAQAAEFSLMQLQQGMSPEDMVKMFEARNDTAAAVQ